MQGPCTALPVDHVAGSLACLGYSGPPGSKQASTWRKPAGLLTTLMQNILENTAWGVIGNTIDESHCIVRIGEVMLR